MIAALPSAFLWSCRRARVRLTRFVLIASIARQRVCLFERSPLAHPESCLNPGTGYRLRRRCLASTSRFGTGQQSGSNRTPLGLHRIAEKIGAGQPIGTVFESRQAIGFIWQGKPDAAIAHRILWLDGLESGFNRGDAVDSHARYIYIHGLANEPTLGRPTSRGCIHLSAADLLPLFDIVPSGTLVWIGA
jgi:L,D-transpeptidase YbiS